MEAREKDMVSHTVQLGKRGSNFGERKRVWERRQQGEVGSTKSTLDFRFQEMATGIRLKNNKLQLLRFIF